MSKGKKEVFILVLSTYRESVGEKLNLKITCKYFGAGEHKIWKISSFSSGVSWWVLESTKVGRHE